MDNQNDFRVVVLCLAYNQAKFIAQCLDGFVMQQTNFPFYAVVHDDASTDGTAEIIKSYAEKYPEIIRPIFETENQWSQKNDTIGRIMFDSCKDAKYVAMCEGDDYWIDPLKIQKQVDFLETHVDYGFVGTNICLDVNGIISKEKPVFSSGKIEGDFVLLGDVFEDAVGGPVTRTVSLLYRKDLMLPYAKIFFSSDIVIESILAKQSKYAFYQEYASVYRVGVGISSSSNKLEKALAYNELCINSKRIQNQLFPSDCHWPEDELEDREFYIRLIYAIRKVKWKDALKYKHMLKSKVYRKKTYSRLLHGPFSCLLLRVGLLLKHHD